MRIAIISDTHIQDGRPALPAMLVRDLASADLILHAGDIADESGLAAIKGIGPQVLAVCGNVDRGLLQRNLPAQLTVETPFGDIAMVHVLPLSTHDPLKVIRTMLPDSRRPLAVVHGHTHRPEIIQASLEAPSGNSAGNSAASPAAEAGQRMVFVINPGSPFRSRGGGHTFAMLEVTDEGAAAWIERLP